MVAEEQDQAKKVNIFCEHKPITFEEQALKFFK